MRYNIDNIRAVVQHKGFDDLMGLFAEYKEEHSQKANERKDTVEKTGMNTLIHGAKAETIDDLIERIESAVKQSFDRKKKKGSGDV